MAEDENSTGYVIVRCCVDPISKSEHFSWNYSSQVLEVLGNVKLVGYKQLYSTDRPPLDEQMPWSSYIFFIFYFLLFLWSNVRICA
jgi:hypothetical protein